MINNNLSDYLVQSKYSEVLQTALYQQNYVAFCVPKGGFDPQPPWVRHWLQKHAKRDWNGVKIAIFCLKFTNSPSGWGLCLQAPSLICLSCIGLFSTGLKLHSFCAQKFTFGSSPSASPVAKSWLHFWSHLLPQTDFSSEYMGCVRNKLINAGGLLSFFFKHKYKISKIAHDL